MRKIIIDSRASKDIDAFKGYERLWITQIINILEDESNSLEYIQQKFKPLQGKLKGYRKAKHRGFGLRIVFRLLNEQEILIIINHDDKEKREIIEFLAIGKREEIYDIAKHRLRNKK
mgnify:CR=1 FL=1